MKMLDQLQTEFHAGLGEIEVILDDYGFARWVDRTLGVTLVAERHHYPIDLGDARGAGLRAELELWSPIIDLELLERDGGRILCCLHQPTHQPGYEPIVGSLRWPLADGHLALDILHPAQLDEQSPESGLPKIRAALARWLDPDRGGVRITRPPTFPRSGERVELPAWSSSIELPVGFLPLVDESVPTGTFVRVGLTSVPTAAIDIWRIPDTSVRDASELVTFAEHSTEVWTDATIDVSSEIIPSTAHRAEVRCKLNVLASGERVLGLAHWVLAHDGAVFRFQLSTKPPEDIDAWVPTFDALLRSWQRLPEPEPASWWKRLFRG